MIERLQTNEHDHVTDERFCSKNILGVLQATWVRVWRTLHSLTFHSMTISQKRLNVTYQRVKTS